MKSSHKAAPAVALWLALLGADARGETWIARCKDLQFRFNRTTLKAVVYFKTSHGIFQVTQGDIRFQNDVAMRAPMDGIQDGIKGPLSEVGLNRSRNIVYVLYRNPTTGQLKDGIFCETTITVEP